MIDLMMCGGIQTVSMAGENPRCCRHSEHALGLHIASSGSYRLGNETVSVCGPYLALLPAGEQDENRMIGSIDSYWCLFRSKLVTGDGHKVEILWPGALVCRTHFRRLVPSEVRQARERMIRIRSLHSQPAAANRLAAVALLLEQLALWASPESSQKTNDSIAAFRAQIEERADDPTCSLATLARAINRHPDGLSRRFSTAYGLSPVKYRTNLRLTRARELIQTTSLGIAEVAKVVGFTNPAYFSRLFFRHFGCRPSDLVRFHR